MARTTVNNIKLGVFVMGGLVFLILLLYMIGQNSNLFGGTYILKARFENVQGLVPGNNVRFSGIQSGTVKRVSIINDTVIEITMVIETKMKKIIRKNAIVSIGTDGLVGNKLVNINPSRKPSALAEEGDVLVSKKAVDTDEMLQTLFKTNNDVAFVADELKTTVRLLNNSQALWNLLNDQSIPIEIRNAAINIRNATAKADRAVEEINQMVMEISQGKGPIGFLVKDTSFSGELSETVIHIRKISEKADSLSVELSRMVTDLSNDINNGKGTIHSLLKDSLVVLNWKKSLENIQNGTDGFNQNMEALKHNFLLRGYFKKLEKNKKKEQEKDQSAQ